LFFGFYVVQFFMAAATAAIHNIIYGWDRGCGCGWESDSDRSCDSGCVSGYASELASFLVALVSRVEKSLLSLL
jgi:hypothetical protein